MKQENYIPTFISLYSRWNGAYINKNRLNRQFVNIQEIIRNFRDLITGNMHHIGSEKL